MEPQVITIRLVEHKEEWCVVVGRGRLCLHLSVSTPPAAPRPSHPARSLLLSTLLCFPHRPVLTEAQQKDS